MTHFYRATIKAPGKTGVTRQALCKDIGGTHGVKVI
jgi:hypothetical protein